MSDPKIDVDKDPNGKYLAYVNGSKITVSYFNYGYGTGNGVIRVYCDEVF